MDVYLALLGIVPVYVVMVVVAVVVIVVVAVFVVVVVEEGGSRVCNQEMFQHLHRLFSCRRVI